MERNIQALLRYAGASPKPEDFERYWKKGLSEIQEINPRTVMKKADFFAPYSHCFDFYFTGIGGARIHAKYLRPAKNGGKHPAVFFFHGYTESARNYSAMLPHAAAGYSMAALDCRGQGGSLEDTGGVRGYTCHGHFIRGLAETNPEKLLYRSVFQDAVQLVHLVAQIEEIDPDRMGWPDTPRAVRWRLCRKSNWLPPYFRF